MEGFFLCSEKKQMLTGNAAIARGFYEAGGIIATSYPGSPTVGVIEKVKLYDEIYAEFSINEKVATEVAIGGSFYGCKSMTVMKHVGVNIASDPLMTFTQTPTNGGFLLVTGDDPGLASSQNEQDSRALAIAAELPLLEPTTVQDALKRSCMLTRSQRGLGSLFLCVSLARSHRLKGSLRPKETRVRWRPWTR